MSVSDELAHARAGAAPERTEPHFARAIDIVWMLWIATLPIGHATGIHNTLSVLVPILVMLSTRAAGIAELPAIGWIVALVALSCLSLIWSAAPELSAGKLRSDLLLPMLGYASAYLWSRQRGANAILTGFAVGLLAIAVMSMVALLPPDAPLGIARGTATATGAEAFPYWYPGDGDASTYAVLVLSPLLVWRVLRGHWRDATSSLLALAVVLVIFVSRNRNAVVVFPVAMIVFALLWRVNIAPRNPSSRLRTVTLLLVFFAGCAGTLATVEKASQQRLADAGEIVPYGSAALELIALDPRPAMWAEYIHLGMQHPWLGAGFGRTVPAIAYHTHDDPVLRGALASGFQHAHNVFLNWWLQLGWCGVLLFVGCLGAIVRSAWVTRRWSRLSALCGVGVLTLVAAMVVRNLTDDFFVYGIASSFWIAVGALLGLAVHYRAALPPIDAVR